MNSAKRTCIFGPIPSRRLGISLGIDLVPYKTCTMDCIYCECGKTTNQTTERKEYFPTDLALKQIDESLGFQKPNLEAHLRRMEKAGFITCEVGPRGIYYRAGKK